MVLCTMAMAKKDLTKKQKMMNSLISFRQRISMIGGKRNAFYSGDDECGAD